MRVIIEKKKHLNFLYKEEILYTLLLSTLILLPGCATNARMPSPTSIIVSPTTTILELSTKTKTPILPTLPLTPFSSDYLKPTETKTWTPNKWRPIGKMGVHVTALAIDPVTSSTLFIGTDSSGLYKSIDNGNTWRNIRPADNYDLYSSIVINPIKPNIVYASTHNHIYKSTNGGDTWTESGNGLYIFFDTKRYLHPIILVINPSDPETLYAAIINHGVYKTWDGGKNWIAVNNGIPPTFIISDLVLDPFNPNVLYLGTNQGVYKTNGGGGYWYQIRYGMTTEEERNITALAKDPVVTSTLYAGSYGGKVYKSIDSGASWIIINNGLPEYSGAWITDIAVDPINPSIIYTGYWYSSKEKISGVYKSMDGGLNWSHIGLNGHIYYYIEIDPVTSTTLYVGTWDSLYSIRQVGE